MLLRPASPDDTDALAALGRDSFCAAFAHLYDPADLSTFLQDTYAPDVIATEIADPRQTHRLAEAGGTLIGFAKLTDPSPYAQYSNAARPVALGQLYTAPARTGEGIGAALMDWALTEARARGADAMQLSVWSENVGAQRFYARYGFARIADIDFWVGGYRDADFLVEARL